MDLLRHVVRAAEMPEESFPWGSIRWLDHAGITGTEQMTFGVVRIDPGQSNPRHYHPNCDEILYVTSGELIHGLGEDEHHLRAGDLIHIPLGVPHQARNPGEIPCTMVVTYNTGRREVVGEFSRV